MNAELLSSSKRLIRMDILTPQQTWLSGNDRAASFELRNGRRQRGGMRRARLVGSSGATRNGAMSDDRRGAGLGKDVTPVG